MKSIMLINVFSIILGVAILSHQGIAYPNREKIVDTGPTQAVQQIKKAFLLSSIWGGLALAGRTLLNLRGINTEK